MKKILIFIALFFGIFGIVSSTTYAAGIEVQVTEKMPWMDSCVKTDGGGSKSLTSDEIADGKTYTCTVQPGFASVQKMLSGMIKYFTFIAGIGGVLFLVVNGIMYSMGGMDVGMKDQAKTRIGKTLSGLVVLLLSGVILNLIAPWIYK